VVVIGGCSTKRAANQSFDDQGCGGGCNPSQDRRKRDDLDTAPSSQPLSEKRAGEQQRPSANRRARQRTGDRPLSPSKLLELELGLLE
jgi:hypothetical protein